jgi:transcriptional regulator with XRE-family HTH domain
MYFDRRWFAACLRTRRGERGLREAAGQIGGVSAATLSRLEREETPDMATFLRLCDWLKMPVSEFLRESAEQASMIDRIAQALRADGVLQRDVITAFITMIRAVQTPLQENQ